MQTSTILSLSRIATLFAVGACACTLLVGFVDSAAAAGQAKVSVCHMTSSETNPEVVITISESALQTHIDHGDLLWDEVYGCEEGPGDPN